MLTLGNDAEFMSDIISRICDYAVDNGMNVTETLKTIAENILVLCDVADFDGWKKEDKHG